MKILAIDSSAVTASVALSENESVLASEFINNGLTHSQTVLPMVERVLAAANTKIGDIDLFAVTNGPGSFTGVRIGVAAVKGLAFAANRPCIGISTLELIAAGVKEENALVISCMDARRNQIYTASFESGSLQRVTEDSAVAIESLIGDIRACNRQVILAGDGAWIAYDCLSKHCENVRLASEKELYQNAENLCALAYRYRRAAVSGSALVPTYLRPSQAERELKKKRGENK